MNVAGSHRVSSGDLGARPGLPVGIEGRPPGLLGQRVQRVYDGLAAIDTDRVLQTQIVHMPDKSVHPRPGVAAHQHPRADVLRQLGQRGIEHRDLIGGVVGGGLAWAQHRRQRLTSATGTVIDERQDRMKPIPALEVRCRAFLLRVRTDQRGVQIDHDMCSPRQR